MTNEVMIKKALESADMAPFAMFNIDLTPDQPWPRWAWEIRSNLPRDVPNTGRVRRRVRRNHATRVMLMAERVAMGLVPIPPCGWRIHFSR